MQLNIKSFVLRSLQIRESNYSPIFSFLNFFLQIHKRCLLTIYSLIYFLPTDIKCHHYQKLHIYICILICSSVSYSVSLVVILLLVVACFLNYHSFIMCFIIKDFKLPLIILCLEIVLSNFAKHIPRNFDYEFQINQKQTKKKQLQYTRNFVWNYIHFQIIL